MKGSLNMRKYLSIFVTILLVFSLVSCSGDIDSHSSSNKSQSTNIKLDNNFDTVGSIKEQTDKIAKKTSDKITLKQVSINIPDGNFDKGTAYFIYYGEIKNSATKMSLKIDIASQKIIETKIQKGYPDEVGGALNMKDIDTSINIKTYSSEVCNSDELKKALATAFDSSVLDKEGLYTIELVFSSENINITAIGNDKIFFEKSIANKAI